MSSQNECFRMKPHPDLAHCGPIYEQVTQDTPDPFINMRTIRVMFHESQFDYYTQINGTRESIANYFRGEPLNLSSDDCNEIIRTAWKIEFVSEEENGMMIVSFLSE